MEGLIKNFKFGMLLDEYSALLTKHQQKICESYYYDDMSLAEIGEQEGVSRQAILDMLHRCEEKLENYEKKLKLCAKFDKIRNLNEEGTAKDFKIKIINILEE